jgi:hypothetical protein
MMARHRIIAAAGSQAYANARRLGLSPTQAYLEAVEVENFIRRIME